MQKKKMGRVCLTLGILILAATTAGCADNQLLKASIDGNILVARQALS
ncbi:MAG: hypothetical protein ACYDBP_10915 [Leptospirales bacterium]